MSRSLIRVVAVDPIENDAYRVHFLREDRAGELVMRGTPPLPHAVYEVENDDNPRLTLIGAPDPRLTAWPDAYRWRQNATGPTRHEILRRRATIRRAVRASLDEAGFLEIEAPLLVRGTTPDPGVESYPLADGYYLTTSTEYHMKRLAVGGFEKIYSLTKNFRKDDRIGPCRNPEFTMLEWGRVGEGMDRVMDDAERLTLAALDALKLGRTIRYGDCTIDLTPPWDRQTVAEAIARNANVPMPDFGLIACQHAADALGLKRRDAWANDRDFLFALIMDAIQPKLGATRPVFLTDWPLFQTTSANAKKDAKTADRAELFIAGIELADGFGGLADPALQAHFFEAALAKRATEGLPAIAVDQSYLDAMRQGAPFGAGMALGFDRLVMLLTNQPEIRTVLAFGWDEL
jgi:lysyl-tRNA synthetase class 2